jgi:hypothetical protein
LGEFSEGFEGFLEVSFDLKLPFGYGAEGKAKVCFERKMVQSGGSLILRRLDDFSATLGSKASRGVKIPRKTLGNQYFFYRLFLPIKNYRSLPIFHSTPAAQEPSSRS